MGGLGLIIRINQNKEIDHHQPPDTLNGSAITAINWAIKKNTASRNSVRPKDRKNRRNPMLEW